MLSARKLEYVEYLKSAHWIELSGYIKKRDNHTCRDCGTKDQPLEAHHLKYRKRFEDTIPDELLTLCRACHQKRHDKKLNAGKNPKKQHKREIRAKYHNRYQFQSWDELCFARNYHAISRGCFQKWRAILKPGFIPKPKLTRVPDPWRPIPPKPAKFTRSQRKLQWRLLEKQRASVNYRNHTSNFYVQADPELLAAKYG